MTMLFPQASSPFPLVHQLLY